MQSLIGIKLRSKIGVVETISIEQIKEKLIRGKKYYSAYSGGALIFVGTENQCSNLSSFLKNEYQVL